MRKIILFGIATLASLVLYSNPNPDPEIHINEFMFTGTNHWSLELSLFYCNLSDFDSIYIQSNAGQAKVLSFHYGTFCYFTDQDLSVPLTVNPEGDIIVITGYDRYYPLLLVSTLKYGNVANAFVLAPASGQSVERFPLSNCYAPYYPTPEAFTLTNNPTIGLENDTTGALSTLHGLITDSTGMPMKGPSYSFFVMDFPLSIDSTGHFTTRVFSRIQTQDTICYKETEHAYLPGRITPISYTMDPDTLEIRDIHFLETILLDGISHKPGISGSEFKVFPNPGSKLVTVSYTTELSSNTGDLKFMIYDMKGVMVMSRNLENRLGIVTIPVDLASGVYIAKLSNSRKTLGTARFIVTAAE